MADFNQEYESLIIHQNKDWLVLNKPAGLSIHNESNQGFVLRLKQQLQYDFLAPVHRLDKVTSGCLLLAKNSNAAAHLAVQFQQQKVEKIYLAITQGKPKKKQGKIIGDMAQGRNGNWRLEHSKLNPAITEFFSIGFKQGFRIAIVKPITGKTHQIRVALKSNSCPIVGDPRYASNPSFSVDRCYLHCWQLSFCDLDGSTIKVTSKPNAGTLFSSGDFWSTVDSKIKSLPWGNKNE